MAPYLVGITGGIGSGKSTLSSIFYHLGYKIYNSDDRAKHLMNFNEKIKKDLIVKRNIIKNSSGNIDICTILEKCSIDEISKYLVKQGEKKKFPDITIRENK